MNTKWVIVMAHNRSGDTRRGVRVAQKIERDRRSLFEVGRSRTDGPVAAQKDRGQPATHGERKCGRLRRCKRGEGGSGAKRKRKMDRYMGNCTLSASIVR